MHFLGGCRLKARGSVWPLLPLKPSSSPNPTPISQSASLKSLTQFKTCPLCERCKQLFTGGQSRGQECEGEGGLKGVRARAQGKGEGGPGAGRMGEERGSRGRGANWRGPGGSGNSGFFQAPGSGCCLCSPCAGSAATSLPGTSHEPL